MIPAHPGLWGGPVYLDYNATTPVDARVVEAMLPHLGHYFGNPSSGHSYGDQPRRALDQARAHVITQVTEHPAVLETCHALERLHGVDVTYVPVDGDGLVDPAALAALTERTVLVSVMAAPCCAGQLCQGYQPSCQAGCSSKGSARAFMDWNARIESRGQH